MKRKVIFIDIDGPLAWATWDDGPVTILDASSQKFNIPYPWVQEDCDALSQIIKQTDAMLVISSDWKKHFGLLQLQFIFEHYGIARWNVADITTHINPRKKMSSSLEWDRACEIHSWVRTFKPENWIAIDDMPLKSSFQSLKIPQWHHVQVDGDFGFGGRLRDKVDECVKKLSR